MGVVEYTQNIAEKPVLRVKCADRRSVIGIRVLFLCYITAKRIAQSLFEKVVFFN
jgi:hypothetical protein